MDTVAVAGDGYFRSMSWVFLALVFIGFAPSFYLSPLVGDHPLYPRGLPWAYIVHGVVLTGWYLLFAVQSSLIISSKRALHRRLGALSVGWAVGVLATTWWAISIFPNRMQELALETGSTVEEVEPGLAGILWLDVFMSLLFLWLGVLIHDRRVEGRVLVVTWTAFGLHWVALISSFIPGGSEWGEGFILDLFS